MSLDETTLDDLATRLAALSPEDAAQVHRKVSGLHAERARIEEERIAWLWALTDLEVVIGSLDFGSESNRDPRAALALLRDAGFIRHVDPGGRPIAPVTSARFTTAAASRRSLATMTTSTRPAGASTSTPS